MRCYGQGKLRKGANGLPVRSNSASIDPGVTTPQLRQATYNNKVHYDDNMLLRARTPCASCTPPACCTTQSVLVPPQPEPQTHQAPLLAAQRLRT